VFNITQNYVMCEHLYKNHDVSVKHKLFRVCCVDCYKKGFLEKNLLLRNVNNYVIGYLEV